MTEDPSTYRGILVAIALTIIAVLAAVILSLVKAANETVYR